MSGRAPALPERPARPPRTRSPAAEPRPQLRRETIAVLESVLDDCSPQVAAYTAELALERGALDAYCRPVVMKKSRPGFEMVILSPTRLAPAMARLILEETPSLGVRVRNSARWVLPRRVTTVATVYGAIRVKSAGGKAMPEFEDCRAAARLHRVPLRLVQAAALAAWRPATP